ncbi:RDD family protein [Terricaulis silvestris]|uniref:RDD family protein n=1 Tax=Terricaulis silvestris TaxID=2686094 RepID=A0A6I6MU66_9CAUL|nr:RDD family protein [Terricaulis silvestris]QGZ94713.1 RDD family protein [Terricaulis silvestris]
MADVQKTAVQQAAEDMDTGGILVRRWLGCWIDLLALVALFFVPALAIGLIPNGSELPANTILIPALALSVLYFPVTEGFRGRSLGKLITGLKVVDKDGRTPGIGRAFVRTLTRLVEVNPVLAGGVPAGIVVLCTKRKQRLGDLLAGTYVMSADSLKQMADVDATLAAMRSARAQ